MATQQKALFLNAIGKELIVRSTDIYKPAPGELLIKIKSVALNPIDWKLQKFDLDPEMFPLILGSDAAGEVVDVGKDVNGFENGDKVIFVGDLKNRTSVFQQYAVCPVFRVAKIPSGWSYDEASTMPTGFISAWMGLYHTVPFGSGYSAPTNPDSARKYTGMPIVILGGATSVGQFAIQLAKYSGFSPIITTASLKHEPYLKSLGATHVLDRNISLSDLSSHVRNITKKPIDLVFDTVSSADTQQAGYNLVSDDGKIIILTPPALEELKGSRKTLIRINSFAGLPRNEGVVKEVYANFTSFAEANNIIPNRPEVVPNGLNGIPAGLKRLENNQVSGVKLVIHPEETM